ncbi:MAG: DUF433 domain-containing protein [Snowella sp.]|nr:DUF433 domain-containing protein [Snowella sp.]
MTSVSIKKSQIIATERGLSISGTRITLYDVLDYVKAQYPAPFIASILGLTDEQINVALAYIADHSAEVETEYQQVLKEAEDLQNYYQEQNQALKHRINQLPAPQGKEAAWEKFQAQKAKS